MENSAAVCVLFHERPLASNPDFETPLLAVGPKPAAAALYAQTVTGHLGLSVLQFRSGQPSTHLTHDRVGDPDVQRQERKRLSTERVDDNEDPLWRRSDGTSRTHEDDVHQSGGPLSTTDREADALANSDTAAFNRELEMHIARRRQPVVISLLENGAFALIMVIVTGGPDDLLDVVLFASVPLLGLGYSGAVPVSPCLALSPLLRPCGFASVVFSGASRGTRTWWLLLAFSARWVSPRRFRCLTIRNSPHLASCCCRHEQGTALVGPAQVKCVVV